MQSFEYLSLPGQNNHIRLLDLLPGNFEDSITIRIRNVTLAIPNELESKRMDLDQLKESLPSGWRAYETIEGKFIFVDEGNGEPHWIHPNADIDRSLYELPAFSPRVATPSYEALSYTWGSLDRPQKILVENDDTLNAAMSELFIYSNLDEALRYLRYTDAIRTLWVDAICINQKDEQERNEKVVKMADIYSYASRVIVWLGSTFANSQEAFSVLSHTGKQCEFSSTFEVLGHPDATEKDWHSSMTELPYTEDDCFAIAELLERPWFSRLWVVQDVQLANLQAVIKCGKDEMLWNEFSRALHCLGQNKNILPVLKSLIKAQLFLLIPNTDLTFPNLIYQHWGKLCSDGRDRIYGLLGLAPVELRQMIKLQYSESPGVVFRDAFLACVQYYQRLEFLQFCYLMNHRAGIPTWVPELSSEKPDLSHLEHQFSAGYSQAFITIQAPNMLEVSGIECHTVKSLSSLAPKESNLVLEHIRYYAPKLMAEVQGKSSNSVLEILARTLAVDGLSDRFLGRDYPTLERWMSDVERSILDFQDFLPETLAYFNEWCVVNLAGRPFFITEDGTLGLGPPETEPGEWPSSYIS